MKALSVLEEKEMKSSETSYMGQVFGRLTVLREAGRNKNRDKLWELQCSCGKTHICTKSNVIRGDTKSCGCMKGYNTHGLTMHPACRAYRSAKTRCTNKNIRNWNNYGGRGIEFRLGTIDEFISKMLPSWFKGATIDRIDNNGHYEYGNIRWATYAAQNRNRRNNVMITYYMVTLTLADWAKELSMDPKNFAKRIKAWGIERAITTPIKRRYHAPA